MYKIFLLFILWGFSHQLVGTIILYSYCEWKSSSRQCWDFCLFYSFFPRICGKFIVLFFYILIKKIGKYKIGIKRFERGKSCLSAQRKWKESSFNKKLRRHLTLNSKKILFFAKLNKIYFSKFGSTNKLLVSTSWLNTAQFKNAI